jgi:hypothetical protein
MAFLVALPVRLMFDDILYHAVNLDREALTLAHMDDSERLHTTDGSELVQGNLIVSRTGLKYPHLDIPEARINAMSLREFRFRLRQAYLNYLQAEAHKLEESPVTEESTAFHKSVELIKNQLEAVANDPTYKDPPETYRGEETVGDARSRAGH